MFQGPNVKRATEHKSHVPRLNKASRRIYYNEGTTYLGRYVPDEKEEKQPTKPTVPVESMPSPPDPAPEPVSTLAETADEQLTERLYSGENWSREHIQGLKDQYPEVWALLLKVAQKQKEK